MTCAVRAGSWVTSVCTVSASMLKTSCGSPRARGSGRVADWRRPRVRAVRRQRRRGSRRPGADGGDDRRLNTAISRRNSGKNPPNSAKSPAIASSAFWLDRPRPGLPPPRSGRSSSDRPSGRFERQIDDRHMRVLPDADRRGDQLVDRLQPLGRDRAAGRIVDQHRDVDAAQLPGRVLEELHGLVDVVIGGLVGVRGRRSARRGFAGGVRVAACPAEWSASAGVAGWLRRAAVVGVSGRSVRQGAGDADRLSPAPRMWTVSSWLSTWLSPYLTRLSLLCEKSMSASDETRKLPRPSTGTRRSVISVS